MVVDQNEENKNEIDLSNLDVRDDLSESQQSNQPEKLVDKISYQKPELPFDLNGEPRSLSKTLQPELTDRKKEKLKK